MLELFLSLKHEFAAECPMNEISYREMKRASNFNLRLIFGSLDLFVVQEFC
ncbi:unnamed protein product [Camellia sinensis]